MYPLYVLQQLLIAFYCCFFNRNLVFVHIIVNLYHFVNMFLITEQYQKDAGKALLGTFRMLNSWSVYSIVQCSDGFNVLPKPLWTSFCMISPVIAIFSSEIWCVLKTGSSFRLQLWYIYCWVSHGFIFFTEQVSIHFK